VLGFYGTGTEHAWQWISKGVREILDPELTVTAVGVETSVAQQGPGSGFPAVGEQIAAGFAAGVGLNTIVALDEIEKSPDAAFRIPGLHKFASLVAGF